jgi:hypothetical protein
MSGHVYVGFGFRFLSIFLHFLYWILELLRLRGIFVFFILFQNSIPPLQHLQPARVSDFYSTPNEHFLVVSWREKATFSNMMMMNCAFY